MFVIFTTCQPKSLILKLIMLEHFLFTHAGEKDYSKSNSLTPPPIPTLFKLFNNSQKSLFVSGEFSVLNTRI